MKIFMNDMFDWKKNSTNYWNDVSVFYFTDKILRIYRVNRLGSIFKVNKNVYLIFRMNTKFVQILSLRCLRWPNKTNKDSYAMILYFKQYDPILLVVLLTEGFSFLVNQFQNIFKYKYVGIFDKINDRNHFRSHYVRVI